MNRATIFGAILAVGGMAVCGCAADNEEFASGIGGHGLPESGGAAIVGGVERQDKAGRRVLLPLPPELRGRISISNEQREGRRWAFGRREVESGGRREESQRPLVLDSREPVERKTIATLGGGTPVSRNALFPRDERAELSDSIQLDVRSADGGVSARSGQLVAVEEDLVIGGGRSGALDLLRPQESALEIGQQAHFYGEVLRTRDRK